MEYVVRRTTTFRLEACGNNGQYVDICSDSLNVTQLATLACNTAGYRNSEING